MKIRTALLSVCTAMGLAATAAVAQSGSPLTLSRSGGHAAHIFPTYQLAKSWGMVDKHRKSTPSPAALLYHGGPVMQPTLRFYVVFWQPPTLQDGTPSVLSSAYKSFLLNLVRDYFGHSISSVNTQYYQQSGGTKTFINGQGALVSAYTDTNPFPASGCAASIGPNCFTDDQLAAEVQNVLSNRHWNAGLDAMFLFFTPQNEGSCFDTTTNYCSTETANVNPYYCAYHSYIGGTTPIVYSNEPFGNPNYCLGSGTQPNLLRVGPEADPAATGASHEMSEAITDPELNAWYASNGQENGDLCAYNYVVNAWANHTANQYWNGHVYELQSEYNNHRSNCVLAGP